MNKIPAHVDVELPPADHLLRSTLIAVAVAVAILVIAVLPAEYGVDPTGIGRTLGLTQMGEIKASLAREAAADAAADAAEAEPLVPADAGWRDVTIVTLAPNEGKEVKLVMQKGDEAQFAWVTVDGVVNHDTHGDSTRAPKSYINYRKGTGVTADSGELVAAMDGSHGWFWRNRSNATLTVTLRTRGAYAALKKM